MQICRIVSEKIAGVAVLASDEESDAMWHVPHQGNQPCQLPHVNRNQGHQLTWIKGQLESHLDYHNWIKGQLGSHLDKGSTSRAMMTAASSERHR